MFPVSKFWFSWIFYSKTCVFVFLIHALELFPANISTSDQRCWNNVDRTLKMKQNRTSLFQHCTMLIQRSTPTLKQRQKTLRNVAHCFNVASTLLKLYRKKSGYWIWIKLLMLKKQDYFFFLWNGFTCLIVKSYYKN